MSSLVPPLCLAPHPLSDFVVCVLDKGHAIEHSAGDEPGMAVWKDGERTWRYREYQDEAQFLRLHGVADWARRAQLDSDAEPLFGVDRNAARHDIDPPTPLALRLFDEASWRIKAAWRALVHGWETIR